MTAQRWKKLIFAYHFIITQDYAVTVLAFVRVNGYFLEKFYQVTIKQDAVPLILEWYIR